MLRKGIPNRSCEGIITSSSLIEAKPAIWWSVHETNSELCLNVAFTSHGYSNFCHLSLCATEQHHKS
eukprot:UN3891